jgi:thiol-disulfide isomerase/thioredoxin
MKANRIPSARRPQELFIKILIFGAFLVSSGFCEDPPEGWWADSEIPKLTNETFYKEIGQSKWVIVEFFTPWCIYCYNLKPDFERINQHFVGGESGRNDVLIAQVNGADFKDLKSKYKVNSFPTILMFEPESMEIFKTFQGERDYESIKRWIDKRAKPIRNLTIEAEAKEKSPLEETIPQVSLKTSSNSQKSKENPKNQTTIIVDDPSNSEEEYVITFEEKDTERDFEVEVNEPQKNCEEKGIDEETIEFILNEVDGRIAKSFKKTLSEVTNKIREKKNMQNANLSDLHEKLAEIEKQTASLGEEANKMAKQYENESSAFIGVLEDLKSQLESLKIHSDLSKKDMEGVRNHNFLRQCIYLFIGSLIGLIAYSLFQKYQKINHRHTA